MDRGTCEALCNLYLLTSKFAYKLVKQEEIAKSLGVSQQTVSRILKELEASGLIRRNISKEGEVIELTQEGEAKLIGIIEEITKLITRNRVVVLRGRVVSGKGEGSFFVSLPYYREAFMKYLGFEVFPGTLNVVLYDRQSIENRVLLDISKGIEIPEHREPERILGSVKAFPATVNGVSPAAVVLPSRTVHPKSVIEIISPYKLREKIGLKDGDEVEVEVFL